MKLVISQKTKAGKFIQFLKMVKKIHVFLYLEKAQIFLILILFSRNTNFPIKISLVISNNKKS